MSVQQLSPRIREVIRQLSGDERSIDIALGAIIGAADDSGSAPIIAQLAIATNICALFAPKGGMRSAKREGLVSMRCAAISPIPSFRD